MDRLRRGIIVAAGGLLTSMARPGLIPLAGAVTPFKETMTTLFWVGEAAGEENAFIPNDQSYWDGDWLDHYGGIDNPEHRSGHWPAGFRPRENPFYCPMANLPRRASSSAEPETYLGSPMVLVRF